MRTASRRWAAPPRWSGTPTRAGRRSTTWRSRRSAPSPCATTSAGWGSTATSCRCCRAVRWTPREPMSRAGPRIDVSTSAGSKRTSLLLAVAALTAGVLAPPGCVTTSEGDKMRADINTLRVRLDEIDKRDKEYKEQVVRLHKVLDEATALLTRNSA